MSYHFCKASWKNEGGSSLRYREIFYSKHMEIIFHFKSQCLFLNINICFCTQTGKKWLCPTYPLKEIAQELPSLSQSFQNLEQCYLLLLQSGVDKEEGDNWPTRARCICLFKEQNRSGNQSATKSTSFFQPWSQVRGPQQSPRLWEPNLTAPASCQQHFCIKVNLLGHKSELSTINIS